MATNWPPAVHPAWPPPECNTSQVMYSSVQVMADDLLSLGFSRANPTAQENNDFFKGVRCDEGHPCQGIMIVSPGGVRYPFAYCTGANHKSALVLWQVAAGVYDLGWGSGEIT